MADAFFQLFEAFRGAEAPAAPQGIAAAGQSSSWQRAKKNVVRLFLEFLKTAPGACGDPLLRADTPFEALGEQELCQTKVYEQFAHFLVHRTLPEGVKRAGEHALVGPVIATLSSLLNQVKDRFVATGSAEARLFLTCLDTSASTDAAQWLRGVKKNARRMIAQRAMETGEATEAAAQPIYCATVAECVRALAMEGSAASQASRLALLTVHQVCGRAGEASWITWGALEWDLHFGQLFVDMSQSKTSKRKVAVFHAGDTADLDFLVALGDVMALDERFSTDNSERLGADWFLPALTGVGGGRKLGAILKSLLPVARGGNVKYGRWAVDSLPEAPVAQG